MRPGLCLADTGSRTRIGTYVPFVSAFAELEGCLRRTLCLDKRARGDLFIVTGTEAIDLGLVPASTVCSPLRGRSLFTPYYCSSLQKFSEGYQALWNRLLEGVNQLICSPACPVISRTQHSTRPLLQGNLRQIFNARCNSSPSLSLPGLGSHPGSHGDLTKYWSRHFVY